jgi:hypothetical protein
VYDTRLDHIGCPGGIGFHMLRRGMSVQCFHARLFLDNDGSVWPKLGLKGLKVGTSITGTYSMQPSSADSRHIGSELLEHCIAHAGFGGDKGEDVQHRSL